MPVETVRLPKGLSPGGRLKYAREAMKISLVGMETMTEISRGTLAKYEASLIPAPRYVVLAYEAATGFPLEWLESDQGNSAEPAPRLVLIQDRRRRGEALLPPSKPAVKKRLAGAAKGPDLREDPSAWMNGMLFAFEPREDNCSQPEAA
jgi:transcriptional regulator with XRE-family HTH domain